jgi:plasmid segregation protein ParM
MVVLGLDVGYSNLKLAVGEAGTTPRLLVRPAGAAPAERLGERVSARRGGEETVLVDLAGTPWAAGIEPLRLEGWQRSLHADYSTTPAYRALVQAALALSRAPRIDRLVTGLPVSQAQDPTRREALRRLLQGRHPTPFGPVEVAEVRLLPQPVGAFVDLLWSDATAQTLERIESGTVLVLDVGHYSFDWALVVAGELRRGASGTSLEAMSVLLERAARLIGAEHGGKPPPLALEAALRAGRRDLPVRGRRVVLRPVLERAAREVGTLALEALREALRREITEVDLVLFAGGGGELYGRVAADLFPGADLRLAPEPVTANVRGFFRYGGR